jgi:hypothetical protein
MFYFGGMTLGYLTPPGRKADADSGKTVGIGPREDELKLACERVPTGESLVARANWFGLYW